MNRFVVPVILLLVIVCSAWGLVGQQDCLPLYFDDVMVQVTGVNLTGIAGDAAAPDTTEDYGALTFAGSGVGTYYDMAAIIQLPHSWKNGTKIHPHIHVRNKTAGNGTATWELWYKAARPVVGTYTAAWTVATLTYAVPAATSTHQLYELAEIDMSSANNAGDSAIVMFFLRRCYGLDSDTSTTDINLLGFDVHFQKDRLGSLAENGDSN